MGFRLPSLLIRAEMCSLFFLTGLLPQYFPQICIFTIIQSPNRLRVRWKGQSAIELALVNTPNQNLQRKKCEIGFLTSEAKVWCNKKFLKLKGICLTERCVLKLIDSPLYSDVMTTKWLIKTACCIMWGWIKRSIPI